MSYPNRALPNVSILHSLYHKLPKLIHVSMVPVVPRSQAGMAKQSDPVNPFSIHLLSLLLCSIPSFFAWVTMAYSFQQSTVCCASHRQASRPANLELSPHRKTGTRQTSASLKRGSIGAITLHLTQAHLALFTPAVSKCKVITSTHPLPQQSELASIEKRPADLLLYTHAYSSPRMLQFIS